MGKEYYYQAEISGSFLVDTGYDNQSNLNPQGSVEKELLIPTIFWG